MYYRFFVFMTVAIAMVGVAQAQVQTGYSSTPSQGALLAPIPDDAAHSETATTKVPAPIVTDDGYTASGYEENRCKGECCDSGCGANECGYCSSGQYSFCMPHFCMPSGTPVSSLGKDFFGSDQCYGGPCTSPYLYYKGQFVVESWLDQGYTWNPANPGNQSNLPQTFNDRANEYEMNQLYLVLQRKLNYCKRWDWGARVDLLYGTDYIYTQAVGLETRTDGTNHWNGPGPREAFGGPGGAAMYGLAMPQIYAEFLTPLGYGSTVKVGHFYSTMGHESVMAPENFFYSHSYTMQYAEPFTFTGVLGEYRLRQNLSIKAGIVRGWDAWEDPDIAGNVQRRVGFLGGLAWQSNDERTAVDFNIYTGNEQPDFVDGEMQNRTNYSLVMKRKITPRLTYVMQHDFGNQQKGAFVLDPQYRTRQISTHWYSLVNYVYYNMSEEMSLGFRFEWFNDPELSRVLQLPTPTGSSGGNYYEATIGLNWKPSSFNRLVFRPELRWDWSDVTPAGTQGSYDVFTRKNQFTLGLDVLYTF